MQIRWLTTTTTSTSVQSEQCTDFTHMRTSPPWLQHRDLKLCQEPSLHSLQTCLIRNSAPLRTNARSFIVLVTPFRLSPPSDHIKLPHRDSRLCHGFNRRRLEPTTVLNSTSFSSGSQLVHSFADSTRFHHKLPKLILQLRHSNS